MANYNNGEFILNAIKSVFNQTYKNWELIVIDDASTDNSREILSQFAFHERTRIYYNEDNKGTGYTKKIGVDASSGEICAILDSDDAIKENAFEIVLTNYRKKPDAVMVVSGFEYYDKELKKILNRKYFNRNINIKSILEYGFGFGWDTFLRKSYYKTDGFDINSSAEDQDLYFKMEEVGEVIFLEEYLYKYRQHEQGISQKNKGLDVLFDHLIAIENANKRRLKGGMKTVHDFQKLNKKWVKYHLLTCLSCFEKKNYLQGYKSLLDSFCVMPLERLYMKMNLAFHPIKFWKY